MSDGLGVIYGDPECEPGWEAFTAEWSACCKCRLHKLRTQVVHGRGTLPADLLFIGEAPGKDEDDKGYPFVGISGVILDQLIRDTLVEERQLTYFVANTVGCRPCDVPRGKNRPPSDYEIKQCNPRLRGLIDHVKPSVVVTLGRVAQSVVGPVIERRNRDDDGLNPVKTTHLVHPAFIARSGGVKSLAYQRAYEKFYAYLDETMGAAT